MYKKRHRSTLSCFIYREKMGEGGSIKDPTSPLPPRRGTTACIFSTTTCIFLITACVYDLGMDNLTAKRNAKHPATNEPGHPADP